MAGEKGVWQRGWVWQAKTAVRTPNLVVVDAMNIITRYCFVHDFPGSGVLGYLSQLKDRFDEIVVAFDVKNQTTFRHEIFPEYKANRKDKSDPSVSSLVDRTVNEVKQGLAKWGMKMLEFAGYEADDVIGAIVQQWPHHVAIISNDKDLWQLVSNRVQAHTHNGIVTPDVVLKKLGFRPDQVVDYKALAGDKGDNIPGVHKVGPVTAVKLLAQYGTLDGIYANIDHIARNSTKYYLEEGKEMAYLSQRLAKLATDLPVTLPFAHRSGRLH